MKIAMTGVSGNMGAEALRQTLGLPGVERVRVLLTRRKKNEGLAHRLAREYGQRLEVLFGDLRSRSRAHGSWRGRTMW